MAEDQPITQLLESISRGDKAAQNALFDLVYAELKRIARSNLRRFGANLTINPTTLVHEAWLRFSRLDAGAIEGKVHFYNTVSQAMRHFLSDFVEHKLAAKRGGRWARTDLTERLENEERPIDEFIAINAALDRLTACDPELSSIVQWHYFAGLSVEEIARLRGTSERTTKRHLAMARSLLQTFMSDAPAAP